MVNLKISSDSSDISIPNEIFIGFIYPNMSREIVIPVSAPINAGDGIANITIETEERRGFGAQTVRFALPIRQARLPEITFPSISELKIIDQPTTSETKGKVTLLSPLKGNGNGIIENEEVIQLVIPVKNAGKGEGYKIKIEPTLPKGIEILEMDKSIDIIKPGETKEIKLILSMPRGLKDITGQTIPLKLALKDYREEISPFEVEYSLPYRENRPKLDIYSYKVYDGQIGKSRGNKDGVIQQGEIIQLEVVFENRGKLGAKGLNCHLSTDKQGVVISEGDRSIGDVKPGEKVKVDFVFAIPKIAEPGNLPLVFELKDKDFSEKKILNLRIFEQGIVEITLEKVSPEVGEKMWVSTNLKDAGLISHLVRNPKDPKIIYLATENKGILKSEDNGVTWKTSGEGISDIHIYCLAIDKDNPEIMYAGTKGRGIYRTRDGGKTWEEININIIILPDGSYPTVKCITIHPVERGRIYIGTDNGLYQSNDGGDTWAYISGLPSREINCITLDPKSPNIIYVGLGYGGLYRSLDGGTSWDILFATKEAKDIGNAILSIVINPNNPKIIYLVSGSGGIIKTIDGGSVWQPVNKGLPVGLVRGGERVYIKYLEIDPDNPSILYAVSSESKVYITRDGGGSWQEYGYGISELVEPQEIQFISVDRNGGVIAGGKDKLIDLEQIKEKQIIPMVNFEFDSDKLKKEAFPILDNIVKTLKADPSKKAVIKGHTDNIGSIEYNLDLSKRRAESVRKYLVSKGIAPERLTCYGYGESMPIATNETEEGRAKNRRVEIYIVGR
jgi:outer membrane protein OmpA-like peptidoglycan-associated protein